jgi:pimeloyl-ACP methyl ester carboxylesterase
LQGFIRRVPYSLLKKHLIGNVTTYFNDESPEERSYAKSFLETVAADTYYRTKFIGAIGLVGDMAVQEKMRAEEFAPVDGKILLLQPEKDIFSKEDQHRLERLLPNAEVHTMRGGHLSFIACADEYIALISEFLRKI